MFRNYSFNFGRNVAKRGRNMERRRERNIRSGAEICVKVVPSEFLRLLRSRPYLRDREMIVFRCSETPPSILNQSAPNVEEHITVTQGVT